MVDVRKNKAWMAVDIAMMAAMPLLMAYALVGEFAHERIGIIAGMLFVAHVCLNFKAVKATAKARWNVARALRAAVMFALAAALAVTMATGITASHYLFAGLSSPSGTLPFEIAHMTAAHWAFALAGIHLGLNGKRIVAAIPQPKCGGAKRVAAALLPLLAVLLGIAAFVRRGFWRYLLGLNHFALIDPMEPVWRCIADYLLIAALFVVVGHIAGKAAEMLTKKKRPRKGHGVG